MKTILALLLLASSSVRASETARPRFEPGCVLAAVAFAMNVNVDTGIPLPAIRFESETPLKDFQDAIEPQWGFRPDFVTNAYVPSARTIFLTDERNYYTKHNASIDDSLAHELVHYIQVRYKGLTMQEFSDWEEMEARQYQIWFRDHYINGTHPSGAPECPTRG